MRGYPILITAAVIAVGFVAPLSPAAGETAPKQPAASAPAGAVRDPARPAGNAPAPRPKRRARGRRPSPMDRMLAPLNLTVWQQQQIKPVLDDVAKQVKFYFSDDNYEPQEQQAKVRMVFKSGLDKVRTFLTDEQKARLDAELDNANFDPGRLKKTPAPGAKPPDTPKAADAPKAADTPKAADAPKGSAH